MKLAGHKFSCTNQTAEEMAVDELLEILNAALAKTSGLSSAAAKKTGSNGSQLVTLTQPTVEHMKSRLYIIKRRLQLNRNIYRQFAGDSELLKIQTNVISSGKVPAMPPRPLPTRPAGDKSVRSDNRKTVSDLETDSCIYDEHQNARLHDFEEFANSESEVNADYNGEESTRESLANLQLSSSTHASRYSVTKSRRRSPSATTTTYDADPANVESSLRHVTAARQVENVGRNFFTEYSRENAQLMERTHRHDCLSSEEYEDVIVQLRRDIHLLQQHEEILQSLVSAKSGDKGKDQLSQECLKLEKTVWRLKKALDIKQAMLTTLIELCQRRATDTITSNSGCLVTTTKLRCALPISIPESNESMSDNIASTEGSDIEKSLRPPPAETTTAHERVVRQTEARTVTGVLLCPRCERTFSSCEEQLFFIHCSRCCD